MRCGCMFAGVGLVLALLGGCHFAGGPVSANTPGIVAPEVLAKASLKYYWQWQVRLGAGEKLQRIWRLDENLYALTNRNRLIAIDAARGEYKWDVDVARPGERVFGICHADNVKLPAIGGIKIILDPPDPALLTPIDCVVVNTLTYMMLINRTTGETLRQHEFTFACNSPGASDGVYFFVGAASGRYHPVRLVDGLTPWVGGTKDMITAAPMWWKRVLYVASRDGRLYAVDPYKHTNRRIWTGKADGPLSTNFHADGEGVFIGSEDYNLYAYDPIEGMQLWVFPTQGSLRVPMQVGKRTIYQWADRDRFYAVNTKNGEKRWEMRDGRIAMAVIKPYAYILTWDRQLKIIHESTGKEEMVLPMNGLDLFVPNANKPVLYVATAEGRFACITAASRQRITAKDLRD